MKLQIGYNDNTPILTLYNIVQSYELGDTRRVEVDNSENGTVWFNLRGKKKPTFNLSFEDLETADVASNFKKIQEMSIPDYLLPVWIKLENANVTNKYTVQTEYVGNAYIYLVKKGVAATPTIRDYELQIYTQ